MMLFKYWALLWFIFSVLDGQALMKEVSARFINHGDTVRMNMLIYLHKDLQELANGQTQIWDMEVFNGSLYALVSTRPMESNSGYLLGFDGETWEVACSFPKEQGVFHMTVSPGYLIIAGSDTREGGSGNLYFYDGDTLFDRQVTLAERPDYLTDHNVDVAWNENTLFVINALKRPAPGPGRIFRSDDMGINWTESFSEGLNWHPNAIYASDLSGLWSACGQVVNLPSGDGVVWNEVPVQDQGIWRFDSAGFVPSLEQTGLLFWDMEEDC